MVRHKLAVSTHGGWPSCRRTEKEDTTARTDQRVFRVALLQAMSVSSTIMNKGGHVAKAAFRYSLVMVGSETKKKDCGRRLLLMEPSLVGGARKPTLLH